MEHQDANKQGSDAVKMGAMARMHLEGSRGSKFQLQDLIGVTARLAQVLAEEVDYLDAMEVKKVERLQDEKRKLTRSLLLMKRELDRFPDLKTQFSEEDIEAFEQVTEIFEEVLEENRRKLLVAREVNAEIVRAISDVVKERSQRPGYTQKGIQGMNRDLTPSVSLNETI